MKLSISMNRREVVAGWVLLAGHLLYLPGLAVTINSILPTPLTDTVLNTLLFLTEFLLSVLIFRRFLGASTRQAFRTPFRCLRFALFGLFLYYLGTFLVGLLITTINADFSNINNDNVYTMVQDKYILMAVSTVLLVPFTEELLYRGMVFRSLQSKSRIAAYVVSTAVFALIHIVGYIGTTSSVTLLLCFMQYIPAGLTLAWAYEKADTIWAPILMHITINQISISLMR